jgi:hypothetical protein
VQAYAGGVGWIETPAGVQRASGALLTQFQRSAARDLVTLLLAVEDGNAVVRTIEPLDSDGARLQGVEVSGTAAGAVRLYFDDQGLVARQQYTDATGDSPATMEERFSDYRPVGGLQVAHTAQIWRNGTLMIERRLRAFEQNVTLDEALFAPPAGATQP